MPTDAALATALEPHRAPAPPPPAPEAVVLPRSAPTPTHRPNHAARRVSPKRVSRRLADAKRLRTKRCLDLALVLASAPVTLPLLASVALIVRLFSGNPVFYRQRRIGLHGQAFDVIKFRTMRPDAEHLLSAHLDDDPTLHEQWRLNHKLEDDPRLTRVGRWLRRTSLDELPQLINVLRGEMSLVGPRPIVEEEMALYGREAAVLHRVPPGLTGLWQVSGRNDLPYRRRVALDAAYVRDWSLRLDLALLGRTFLAVITGRGAR